MFRQTSLLCSAMRSNKSIMRVSLGERTSPEVTLLISYRPNFCAECGEKITRLRWRPWTSRRFCDACVPRFRKDHAVSLLISIITLLGLGFITGRALKPEPAPLIIQRGAPAVSSASTGGDRSAGAAGTDSTNGPGVAQPSLVEEQVYICGARTKKGTPCSRRVHGLVRCWQHKGMPAMLPPDKLIVKD